MYVSRLHNPRGWLDPVMCWMPQILYSKTRRVLQQDCTQPDSRKKPLLTGIDTSLTWILSCKEQLDNCCMRTCQQLLDSPSRDSKQVCGSPIPSPKQLTWTANLATGPSKSRSSSVEMLWGFQVLRNLFGYGLSHTQTLLVALADQWDKISVD